MAGGEQRSNQPVLFSFFAPIVGAFFVPYQGCPSHALMLSTREKNIIGGDYWFRTVSFIHIFRSFYRSKMLFFRCFLDSQNSKNVVSQSELITHGFFVDRLKSAAQFDLRFAKRVRSPADKDAHIAPML